MKRTISSGSGRVFMICAAATLLLVGCGTEVDMHDEVDAEACTHLAASASVAVTAASTRESAPSVGQAHTKYVISLPGEGNAHTGYVSFASAHTGDHVFFTNETVPFEITTAGAELLSPVGQSAASIACATIKGRYVYDLDVGTYIIALGPTNESSFALVAEEGHHEE